MIRTHIDRRMLALLSEEDRLDRIRRILQILEVGDEPRFSLYDHEHSAGVRAAH